MLKYLIILLDNSSASFCHYTADKENKLISIDNLQSAVRFAMIENLNVQFVWPGYELPDVYKDIINTIEHNNIVPIELTADADIIVVNQKDYDACPIGSTVVAKLSLSEMLNSPETLFPLLEKCERVNIVITDPENFKDSEVEAYRKSLGSLVDKIFSELENNHDIQLNILTDRLMLSEMNNCGAGFESLTLAPDGKFYICPAFYYNGESPVGSIETGINIKNPQLFQLKYAPICRECDAYQCRRCVWLNKYYTLEVNTPGHEQCVMSHLEREASLKLANKIKERYGNTSINEIKKLDYLDPFEKLYV